MTIERERYNSPITIMCDGRKCPEYIDTETSDFQGAIAKAKSRGWRPVLILKEWSHLCKDCFTEYRRDQSTPNAARETLPDDKDF